MTTRQAMEHERTSEHARKAAEYNEWIPQPDTSAWAMPSLNALTVEGLKLREKQWHVDHVRDIVPWWVRGVEAANRGEIWRMEDLLDSTHKAPPAPEQTQTALVRVEKDTEEVVDVMAPKKDTRPAGVEAWKFKVCSILRCKRSVMLT